MLNRVKSALRSVVNNSNDNAYDKYLMYIIATGPNQQRLSQTVG